MKLIERIKNAWNGAMVGFSYEAVEPSSTRRPVYVSSRSEDGELPPIRRRALISEARDQLRNFTLAGFALRKHLQFVSYYRFSCETPDAAFNRKLERMVEDWKRRENCDVARRSSFDELMTILESHRAVDGDVGIIRRQDNRLQIVEGDRIKNPPETKPEETWVNGVELTRDGEASKYAVWSRDANGAMRFERKVDAANMDLIAYRTRRDQIRGVSLFAPAVKMISYLYDGLDYALAKLKLEQMMGVVTKLDDGGSLVGVAPTDSATVDATLHEKFGRDLLHIALKPGEEASFMESNNPSQNFQNFTELVSRLIFASLDLPYSFFDGSKTNFYGSKGEFEQYLDTVEKKQSATISTLNEWIFDWLLPNWLANGRLTLPSGWKLEDLRGDVGWRGSGLPYWRLFEYVKETQTAISGGLVDPYALADSFGESLSRNIEKIRQARADAKSKGVFIPYGEPQKLNTGL
ncbi:MAG: phage portal protein [Thermoguttaceae bacterium]|nr:phage portal protein [Thermoguttaceae bacterium]